MARVRWPKAVRSMGCVVWPMACAATARGGE